MDHEDPYRPPQADVLRPPPVPVEGITPRMIEILTKTRPWVLFIAVLGMIFTGLMVFIGLGFGGVMLASGDDPSMAALGVLYIFLAAIYFFPCWYLLKFAGAIKSLTGGGGASAMEEALQRQYSFWRLIGILTLALVGLYVLIFVGIIVLAALGAA